MIRLEERDIIRIIILIGSNLVCVRGSSGNVNGLYYILWWTRPSDNYYLSTNGQQSFIQNQCKFQNCFLTDHFSLPFTLSQFSALLFNSEALGKKPNLPTPTERFIEQKYVLVATAPAALFPINAYYNNVFNWTLTYKLDSDIVNANIAIRDSDGQLIGPKKDMHWIPIENMEALDKEVIRKLEKKTSAVAWLVRGCHSMSPHKSYVRSFRDELAKYNYSIEILGYCEESDEYVKTCRDYDCSDLIQSKYRFLLTFENEMCEDYVTDQLLIALNNYAVPIVFGGANYTRFMPDGIYLDAFELGADELAAKIYSMQNDHILTYYDMFKWHKHYNYHNPRERPDSNALCVFCSLLNNNKKRKEETVYTNIVKWFNERKDWDTNPKPTDRSEVTRWLSRF